MFGDGILLVLVTYDVNTETAQGRSRLTHVAKICKQWGQRVQNSCFECDVDQAQYVQLKSRLLNEIDSKSDSLRFYNLGNHYSTRIEQFGCKQTYDPEDSLIL